MVVEVFIPQGQAIDPLGYEFLDRVLDQSGVAMVGKTGGELPDDPRSLLDLAEQQAAGIRTDRSAVERRHDFPPPQGLK